MCVWRFSTAVSGRCTVNQVECLWDICIYGSIYSELDLLHTPVTFKWGLLECISHLVLWEFYFSSSFIIHGGWIPGIVWTCWRHFSIFAVGLVTLHFFIHMLPIVQYVWPNHSCVYMPAKISLAIISVYRHNRGPDNFDVGFIQRAFLCHQQAGSKHTTLDICQSIVLHSCTQLTAIHTCTYMYFSFTKWGLTCLLG